MEISQSSEGKAIPFSRPRNTRNCFKDANAIDDIFPQGTSMNVQISYLFAVNMNENATFKNNTLNIRVVTNERAAGFESISW